MVFRHEIVRRLRRDRSSLNLGVATATGASLSYGENWPAINWQQVYRNVRRLQTRIVKAVKAGKKRRVRALRNILTRSFSGKVLAIKRVSSNQGKRTPGVDHVLWNTPKKKAQAIRDLRPNGYQPLPLKRVYRQKKDGTLRPLGIPVMRDRGMQGLHLLALDPVAETLAGRPAQLRVSQRTVNGGCHRPML